MLYFLNGPLPWHGLRAGSSLVGVVIDKVCHLATAVTYFSWSGDRHSFPHFVRIVIVIIEFIRRNCTSE
jgi:hypothetical protein